MFQEADYSCQLGVNSGFVETVKQLLFPKIRLLLSLKVTLDLLKDRA